MLGFVLKFLEFSLVVGKFIAAASIIDLLIRYVYRFTKKESPVFRSWDNSIKIFILAIALYLLARILRLLSLLVLISKTSNL